MLEVKLAKVTRAMCRFVICRKSTGPSIERDNNPGDFELSYFGLAPLGDDLYCRDLPLIIGALRRKILGKINGGQEGTFALIVPWSVRCTVSTMGRN